MEIIKDKEYIPRVKKELRSSLFYRDVFAEFLGTFLFVSVIGSLPQQWGSRSMGSIVQIAMGEGMIITCLNWSLLEFGGCLLNPALVVNCAIIRKITIYRAGVYIVTEVFGAIAGAAFIWGMTPGRYHGELGVTKLHSDMNVWQGLLVEVWITFILVMTHNGSYNIRRKPVMFMPAIVYGYAKSVGVFAGFSHTGASMNPARSFGMAVIMNKWDDHWLYWIGPILGAVLAANCYHFFLDKMDRPHRKLNKMGIYMGIRSPPRLVEEVNGDKSAIIDEDEDSDEDGDKDPEASKATSDPKKKTSVQV